VMPDKAGAVLQRGGRILPQKTKNKLYTLHAPEVERISTGRHGARSLPVRRQVKATVASAPKEGLIGSMRSVQGSP
jgi:hypothetical protein